MPNRHVVDVMGSIYSDNSPSPNAVVGIHTRAPASIPLYDAQSVFCMCYLNLDGNVYKPFIPRVLWGGLQNESHLASLVIVLV